VDHDTGTLEKASLLPLDLGTHAIMITRARIRPPELGRAEEATVLYTVERRVR
jgi:hypothetical protein